MQPKRICFGSIHKNALKENSSGKAAGFFNVPFVETVGPLFPWELFENRKGQWGGYYRVVPDNAEFEAIREWIGNHSDLVLIRSLFKTAVAACEHYASNDQRSSIGELEHSAKYQESSIARGKLVLILEGIFRRLYSSQKLDAIVSVPPSSAGAVSLPNHLAANLAAKVGLPDLTGELHWNGPKGSIKELDVEAKWGALQQVGITVGQAVEGKNLLLIDDMYQSGATAHFVGSRLRAAGANDLHLLAVSKGRRDTDNT
jgi:predicted amidophosphoribosyltransferase